MGSKGKGKGTKAAAPKRHRSRWLVGIQGVNDKNLIDVAVVRASTSQEATVTYLAGAETEITETPIVVYPLRSQGDPVVFTVATVQIATAV